MTFASRGRALAGVDEGQECRPELLGTLEVGRVPALLQLELGDLAACGRVAVEHRASLLDHRLRGRDVVARPPGDDARLAQLVEIEERRIADDRVERTVNPQD